MDRLDASLAALRALVLRLRLSGANAISGLPLLSPRTRLSHTDGDDEENEQNRYENGDEDNGEGNAHDGPFLRGLTPRGVQPGWDEATIGVVAFGLR